MVEKKCRSVIPKAVNDSNVWYCPPLNDNLSFFIWVVSELVLSLLTFLCNVSGPKALLWVPQNHWCFLLHHGASQPIARSKESCSPGSRLPITQHLSSIMSWSFAWGNDGRSWTTAFLQGRRSCSPETSSR